MQYCARLLRYVKNRGMDSAFFWRPSIFCSSHVCMYAHALDTIPAPCCRHSWCLLLGPGGTNKPEQEPIWKSDSALKWWQKVSSVCHGQMFLPLVGFLEVGFIFLFTSPIFPKYCPISPLGGCPDSLTWHIWVETEALWFVGWLEEKIAAPFPVPSRDGGAGGRAVTSRGRNASAAQAGQRWGAKPPADLFQGEGRAVLCCLQVVLFALAPCLQGPKLLHQISPLPRKHRCSASTCSLLVSLLSSVIFKHVLKVEFEHKSWAEWGC